MTGDDLNRMAKKLHDSGVVVTQMSKDPDYVGTRVVQTVVPWANILARLMSSGLMPTEIETVELKTEERPPLRLINLEDS